MQKDSSQETVISLMGMLVRLLVLTMKMKQSDTCLESLGGQCGGVPCLISHRYMVSSDFASLHPLGHESCCRQSGKYAYLEPTKG